MKYPLSSVFQERWKRCSFQRSEIFWLINNVRFNILFKLFYISYIESIFYLLFTLSNIYYMRSKIRVSYWTRGEKKRRFLIRKDFFFRLRIHRIGFVEREIFSQRGISWRAPHRKSVFSFMPGTPSEEEL